MVVISRVAVVRLCLGFAVLPVVDGVLSFGIHRLLWSAGPYEGAYWGNPADAAAAFAVSVAIVAVFMTGAGAIPTLYWLLSRGWLSFRQIILVGVAVGNAPFAISAAGVLVFYGVGLATASDVGYVLVYGPMGAVRAIAIGSVLGAASAATFWVVAVLGTEYGR